MMKKTKWKKCPNCQNELEDLIKCKHCGEKVNISYQVGPISIKKYVLGFILFMIIILTLSSIFPGDNSKSKIRTLFDSLSKHQALKQIPIVIENND